VEDQELIGRRSKAAAPASPLAIEARLRTGRPLGVEEWIPAQEGALGRPLVPMKRGPKPKARAN